MSERRIPEGRESGMSWRPWSLVVGIWIGGEETGGTAVGRTVGQRFRRTWDGLGDAGCLL